MKQTWLLFDAAAGRVAMGPFGSFRAALTWNDTDGKHPENATLLGDIPRRTPTSTTEA